MVPITASQSAVIGKDDRRPIDESTKETALKATGSVVCHDSSGQGFSSSGTVIQNHLPDIDLVITVSHAFQDQQSFSEYGQCYFSPYAHKYLKFPIIDVIKGNIKADSWGGDWAVAVVDGKTSVNVHFGSLKLSDKTETQILAAQEKGATVKLSALNIDTMKISVSDNCAVKKKSKGSVVHLASMLMHDCDSVDGSSGGSLVLETDGEIELIGILYGIKFNIRKFGDTAPSDYPHFDPRNFVNAAHRIDGDVLEAIKTLERRHH